MKKISLKGISEILSEKELKNVMGGCSPYDGFHGGTCGWHGQGSTICGVSKGVALDYYSTFGGNWCCDSCGSSSYCG